MHPDSALVARLAEFDALRAIPEGERAWLVAHGDHRFHEAGEVLLTPDDESQEMIVQLSGRIAVYFGHGAGRRHVAASKAGSITGLLPFSRLKRPPSDVLVEERSEILAIHRTAFPGMIRECPVLIESLVHNMIDRTRRFAAADWQDEKLLSLGRMAAGLAHELNNPASAATSCATRLSITLHEVGVAACRFGELALAARQRELVMDLVNAQRVAFRKAPASALDRADREDRMAQWLEQHDSDRDIASILVDGDVSIESLEQLASSLPADALPVALAWIGAASSAMAAVADLQRSTRRIHDVVSSVRDFTHMDRAVVREPVDIAASLRDTIDILRPEATARHITISLDVASDLPRVMAVAPDLNQVWLHLIANAVDAIGTNGQVKVRAAQSGTSVIVSVIDNGPGIPDDIKPRIFDPFFTTKPVGEGVGLGLDIVRRSVSDFGGDVEVDSSPGNTEFRVRLPPA